MIKWMFEARGNRTQAEIANKAGITQQAYSAIERGDMRPSVETAKRLTRALDLPDWIRFFDDQQAS